MSTYEYACDADDTLTELRKSFRLDIKDIEEAADNWNAAAAGMVLSRQYQYYYSR